MVRRKSDYNDDVGIITENPMFIIEDGVGVEAVNKKRLNGDVMGFWLQ